MKCFFKLLAALEFMYAIVFLIFLAIDRHTGNCKMTLQLFFIGMILVAACEVIAYLLIPVMEWWFPE